MIPFGYQGAAEFHKSMFKNRANIRDRRNNTTNY